jgi:hypothetical protein
MAKEQNKGGAQFTPGPWFTNGETSGLRVRIACAAPGHPHGVRVLGHMNTWSDARLAAAAPDLYEALRGILAITDRAHVAWDKARAALAKSSGEGA